MKLAGFRLTDDSDLDPRFTPFLHTGQRIRVRTGDFSRTGTVGITTGWRPAYLLMHRSNARGSWDVLGYRDHITAVKVGRYYVPWFVLDKDPNRVASGR